MLVVIVDEFDVFIFGYLAAHDLIIDDGSHSE